MLQKLQTILQSICVYTCSNCLYKFSLKISQGPWFFHIRKGNPLGSSTVLFEKEKKSQSLLQNTVYTMFQAVLCVSYTMQVTPSTWVIYIKLPADSLIPCVSAGTEAQQTMLERNTKRERLMERHCLLYFEFCICYFSSAKKNII